MAVVLTYNVNGIRAALKKGWLEWIMAVNPDVICLQEIKATPDQVDLSDLEEAGYHLHWFPAEKKGYSGVALFCKQQPREVIHGMDVDLFDREGRVLTAVFDQFAVSSLYFPSGASKPERQLMKMQFLADFEPWVRELRAQYPKLILAGDFNICHRNIDLHNPQRNLNSPGFLPEERSWLTELLDSGFIDAFRHLNPEPHNYSWWSYISRSRDRNLGWRIDYQLISEELLPQLKRCVLLPKAMHSDHCPVLLEIDSSI